MTYSNQSHPSERTEQNQTDTSRHVKTRPDMTADTSPMSLPTDGDLGIADIPPKELRYTLSTDDLVHEFRVAGITKNKRTITRYLEKGLIDAAKLDSGAWVANAVSAADFIEDKKRQEAMAMELGRDKHRDALRHETGQAETRLDLSEPVAEPPHPTDQVDTDAAVELKIENASLKAKNEQLEARLADKDGEIEFARQQVLEANKAAERAHTESYQYKALLASRDDQFRPMLNSISELTRRAENREQGNLFSESSDAATDAGDETTHR